MVCIALYVGGASPVSQSFSVFSGFAVYFYLIFFFFYAHTQLHWIALLLFVLFYILSFLSYIL